MLNKFYLNVEDNKKLTEEDLLEIYVECHQERLKDNVGAVIYEPLEEFAAGLEPTILSFESKEELETYRATIINSSDSSEITAVKKLLKALLDDMRNMFNALNDDDESLLAAFYDTPLSIIYGGNIATVRMDAAAANALEDALKYIISQQ